MDSAGLIQEVVVELVRNFSDLEWVEAVEGLCFWPNLKLNKMRIHNSINNVAKWKYVNIQSLQNVSLLEPGLLWYRIFSFKHVYNGIANTFPKVSKGWGKYVAFYGIEPTNFFALSIFKVYCAFSNMQQQNSFSRATKYICHQG